MTDYTRTANATAVEGLRQAKDINLAAIGVLESLTSVLVPLSVSILPKSEEIVPTIDTVVHRGFETLVKVVASQYDFGVSALDQLSNAAASS